MFYLDAHWLSDWPLLAEIEEAATTHKDRCVLVIDDAQVPHYHSIPFDSYDGKSLSYDYVKPVLGQAFSQHKVSYLIPNKPQSRAKMVIEPVSTNTPST